MLRQFVTMALAGFASGCVEEARLALPPTLSSGDSIIVSGVGGQRSGTFAIGANRGRFERDETRLAIFQPLYESRGNAAVLSLAGPDFPGGIEVRCRGGIREVGVGSLSAPIADYRLDCAFSTPGGLTLAAVREGIAGMLSEEARAGEIRLDERRFALRSSHAYAGSSIQSGPPVGYEMSAGGRAVAAVDLSGPEAVLTVAPGTDEATRRAAKLTAAILAVIWDPALSGL